MAFVSVLASPGCGQSPESVAGTSAGPVGVTVQPVRRETLRDVTTAPGMVVPALSGDWTVYSPGAAEIAAMPKGLDDVVAIGDVLVRLDIPSIVQEQAARELAVAEARTRVERARSEATRLAGLVERGLAARNASDAARLELSAAESQLGLVAAELAATEAAGERAIIRARFPGVVTQVWHAVGDTVREGNDDPILRVIDTSHLQVAVQLPVALLARVLPGQTASIRPIAGSAPELATVASKPAMTDPNVATGEVRLAFTAPTALTIDTPVSAEILFDERTDVLVVPRSAVRQDATGYHVMLATDDGHARRRDIQVGLTTETTTQISEGLGLGDRVITAGRDDVTEGTPIAFRP